MTEPPTDRDSKGSGSGRRHSRFFNAAVTAAIIGLVGTIVAAVITRPRPDPIPAAPVVAADDAAETPEDTPCRIDLTKNDLNVGVTDRAVIQLDTAGTEGSVERIGGGIVEFRPAENFAGTDAFRYTVRRVDGSSAAARVEVLVRPVNDPPVAPDVNLKGGYLEDPVLVLDLNPLVSDPEGDPVDLVSCVAEGSAHQPQTGLEAARQAQSLFGPLDRRKEERLEKVLVLPVANWIEERVESGAPFDSSLTADLPYRLRDAEGAEAEGRIHVDILIPRVRSLRLECTRATAKYPDAMTFVVKLRGEEVGRSEASGSHGWGREHDKKGWSRLLDLKDAAIAAPCANLLEIEARWDYDADPDAVWWLDFDGILSLDDGREIQDEFVDFSHAHAGRDVHRFLPMSTFAILGITLERLKKLMEE